MQEKQLAISLVIGFGLVALGLVPGLFQHLFQQLMGGMDEFSDRLRGYWPHQPARREMRQLDYEDLPNPVWLTLIGVGLILLSVISYTIENY